mgnify:CR=1 FL=1
MFLKKQSSLNHFISKKKIPSRGKQKISKKNLPGFQHVRSQDTIILALGEWGLLCGTDGDARRKF